MIGRLGILAELDVIAFQGGLKVLQLSLRCLALGTQGITTARENQIDFYALIVTDFQRHDKPAVSLFQPSPRLQRRAARA